MKAAALRHQVIANNVANVNTPGFQASEVVFEERLKAAIEARPPQGVRAVTVHEKHIPFGPPEPEPLPIEPKVRLMPLTQMRQDGNNVDLESEMARLAANQLWYQALVRQVQDEFARLRTVITEGRR